MAVEYQHIDLIAEGAAAVDDVRTGALPQTQAEDALCCMLANIAFESIDQPDKDRLAGNPVFEFLHHVRNAASHRNRWHFRKDQPKCRAEWHGIVIDQLGTSNPPQGKTRFYGRGANNPLHGRTCFHGTIWPADLLYLLRDVEKLIA